MDFEKVATMFGLPGLLIGIWYLLETQKNRRLEKESEAKAKARERDQALEEKKIDALTQGFQSINSKIEEHQRDEFEHHAKTREAVVGLHTSFATQFDLTPPPHKAPDLPRRTATPPRGTYFQQRPSTKGDE